MADNSALAKALMLGKKGSFQNTMELKKQHQDYLMEQATNGQPALQFNDWAKQNHPDKAIVLDTGQ